MQHWWLLKNKKCNVFCRRYSDIKWLHFRLQRVWLPTELVSELRWPVHLNLDTLSLAARPLLPHGKQADSVVHTTLPTKYGDAKWEQDLCYIMFQLNCQLGRKTNYFYFIVIVNIYDCIYKNVQVWTINNIKIKWQKIFKGTVCEKLHI